jgi:hypothetical protein
MTGMEKGIFQADEYQPTAKSRYSFISIADHQSGQTSIQKINNYRWSD